MLLIASRRQGGESLAILSTGIESFYILSLLPKCWSFALFMMRDRCCCSHLKATVLKNISAQ